MSDKVKLSFLISPRSIVLFIGAEYNIIKESGSRVLMKFYLASLSIIIISIISIASIFYAVKLMFHMLHMEILLSIFISLLFIFIYIFLINTFSKEQPTNSNNQASLKWLKTITFSHYIRIFFVCIIAFLISKPIEIFVLKYSLDTKTEKYKTQLLNAYSVKVQSIYKQDLQKLDKKLAFYEQQASKFNSTSFLNIITQFKTDIKTIKDQQNENLNNARNKIYSADFFIYRTQQASRHIISWLICLGMIGLFMLPGLLIYSISANDPYYLLKKQIEKNVIKKEYEQFERRYRKIFKNNYQVDISYYTEFEDAPFNNNPKPTPGFNPQDDFFKKYTI